jgi:hypothetical protein
MYQIITGMSQNYYDLVGRYMIESWLAYWPKEFILNIYTEDNLSLSHPRINIISLDTMGEEYHKFQNENLLKLNDRTKIFAKKAWPIMKNLEENSGKLLWLDADVVTVGEVTKDWLDSLLEKKDFSAHFGVYQSEFYSVETGFFIIDRENRFKEEFLNRYKRIYYERDFSDMKKPFDGDTFGKVIRDMKETKGFHYHELNLNFDKLSPFNGTFKHKMVHLKAKRKYEKNLDEISHVRPTLT